MPKRTVKQMAKTWELAGRALDYAVAMAEVSKGIGQPEQGMLVHKIGYSLPLPAYSWGHAGDAIIDHEKISTLVHHSGVWLAYLGFNHNDDRKFMTSGSTRREAAMRCWARSKLGDEIDIPKELTDG